MQCPAELVYQEVILQPEKMVQWNKTVSVCQVTSLCFCFFSCHLSVFAWVLLKSDIVWCLLPRSFRGLMTTPWYHMMSPLVQQGESCQRGTSARQPPLICDIFLLFCSCLVFLSQQDLRSEIKYIDCPIDSSHFRDFVNVRRVERKRDCYMSAGMATNHDVKPPCGRYVRSGHVSSWAPCH